MGIGRRQFVKLMGIALAGLSVDPLKAVAINSDSYVNKKFGFLLVKPKGWDFVSVKDFGELKADQLLSEEFEPDKNEVWQQLGDPVILIAKYALDKPGYDSKFSPAISVFITHKKEIQEIFEEDENQDLESLVYVTDMATQRIVKDYKSVKEIQPFELSKCDGFDSLWTWTFESIKHKKSLTCQTWSIMIEKGDYLYSFNMIDSKQVGENEIETFKEFVSTIKIV